MIFYFIFDLCIYNNILDIILHYNAIFYLYLFNINFAFIYIKVKINLNPILISLQLGFFLGSQYESKTIYNKSSIIFGSNY